MKAVYHWVHYRRFDAGDADLKGQTVESLCRKALSVTDSVSLPLWERAQDRLFAMAGENDGKQLLLNKVADLTSAVCGEICLVQQSDLQALLELKAKTVQLSNVTKAEIFALGEREAPKGSKFIRGMAYWLAVGDHLFFVKTHEMSVTHIRDYLDWLTKTRTATLDPTVDFLLHAELDPSLDIGDVRSLRVKGNAVPDYSVTASANNDGEQKTRATVRTVADKVARSEQAVPIMEAIFGPAETHSLVSSLGKGEYLSVEAEVKVRGRRTETSKDKLREIAGQIADTSDAEVTIEGKDGRVSNGDAILRTRMPFDIPQEGGRLMDFDHVADQLQTVYARFVADGKIKA
jgi:hypothetical protein